MLSTINLEMMRYLDAHLEDDTFTERQKKRKIFRMCCAKLAVLKRDNWKCISCGSPEDLTIDHFRRTNIIKRSRNGDCRYMNPDAYPLDNCKVLCSYCHTEKNKLMLRHCGKYVVKIEV